jgi:hypothetical protein
MNRLTLKAAVFLTATLIGGGIFSYWGLDHTHVHLAASFERRLNYSSQIEKDDIYLKAAEIERTAGIQAAFRCSGLAGNGTA